MSKTRQRRGTEAARFQVVTKAEQVQARFGGTSIDEQKMIGFAGEGGPIHRLGPLYYWAWARCERAGEQIPSHPHRGFEILSYVIQGTVEHRDDCGHQARVSTGGLQIMQTGSGLEHDETFVEVPYHGFQIWFDPHFRAQITEAPRYAAYAANDLPWTEGSENGQNLRKVAGEGSPVPLVTPDVTIRDLALLTGVGWTISLGADRAWSALVLEGRGHWSQQEEKAGFSAGDYLVLTTLDQPAMVRLEAEESLRLVFIEVPLYPSYPLFPKPRAH